VDLIEEFGAIRNDPLVGVRADAARKAIIAFDIAGVDQDRQGGSDGGNNSNYGYYQRP
jgi:hypothetical protein